MVRTFVISLVAVAAWFGARAADTMTGVFDERFRTLTTRLAQDWMAPPILTLASDDRLVVSFDELAYDRSYLRYRLVHCDAGWQPSALVESEYLDGFNEARVEDYQFSRRSLTNYVNYRVVLPNDDLAFKISGNYLLQVFREDAPDDVVLQTRFMVSESTAVVIADVASVTDVDYNDRHQQLSVVVDAQNSQVEDVYNDLMVYVQQNRRDDNEVMLRQPLRASGKKAFYEHQRKLIFPAGNEYRRVETVSTTYPGMGVESLEFQEPYYHATLRVDSPRSESSYVFDQTQSGRFFIREYDSDRSDIDADYVVTHFALEIPEQPSVSIFLDGDFVNRRFDPGSIMTFNRATGRYEKTLLLKQGAYNYQYLAVGAGDSAGSTALVEGDYYPTRNEYLVKVYHRRRGERYDRLIGATITFFNKNY